MSLDVLEHEISGLARRDREHLMGYIYHLNLIEDQPDHPEKTARLLDDQSPADGYRWTR
jgi:hypothetical protein